MAKQTITTKYTESEIEQGREWMCKMQIIGKDKATKRNRASDKWYAEKMPDKDKGEYIWRVRNLRTERLLGFEMTEYAALSYANEMNLKGHIDE